MNPKAVRSQRVLAAFIGVGSLASLAFFEDPAVRERDDPRPFRTESADVRTSSSRGADDGGAPSDDQTTKDTVSLRTAGAASCQPCHPDVFAEWEASPHGRTGRPLASPPGGSDLSIGSSWMQAHLRRDDSGVHRLLPECYDIAADTWRDVDEVMDAIQGPEMPEERGRRAPRRTARRSFERDCSGCHVSGTRLREDVENKRIDGTWRSTSIDCEACHGPALAHVEAWRNLDDDEPLPDLARLDARAATGVCTRCHGGLPVGSEFTPLDAEHWVVSPLTRQSVYSHGAATGQIYQADAFLRSACFLQGDLTCSGCHDGHADRMQHREHADAICSRCHAAQANRAHTHHAANDEGGRCVACHMPMLLPGLLSHQRDHRISSPLPAAPETPDACTACHESEGKEWAAEWSELWWGPPPRETLDAVRGVQLARTGNTKAARPLLERATSHPEPFFRWAAASWLGDPASLADETLPEGRLLALELASRRADGVELLRSGLNDPSPYLRSVAYASLLRRGPVQNAPELEDLELSSRVARDAAEIRVALARVYLSEQRVSDAIDLLEETVVFRRRHPGAWLVLAAAYELDGRKKAAAGALRRWVANAEPLPHLDGFLSGVARAGEASLARAVLAAVSAHAPSHKLRVAARERRDQYEQLLGGADQ